MSMKKIVIVGPMGAGFGSGILELTKAQVKRRAHALDVVKIEKDKKEIELHATDTKPGLYTPNQVVTFKCGEEIGYDGPGFNKGFMKLVGEPEETKPEKKAPAQDPAAKKAAAKKAAGKAKNK